MSKSLVAPVNYTVFNEGVTFSIEFKLAQSRERDWAPYDMVQAIIFDDCHMVVHVVESKSVKLVQQSVRAAILRGLTRSPCSAEILARRAQLALF